MQTWKYPKTIKEDNLLHVTDEMLDAVKVENEECEAYNKLLYQKYKELRSRLIADAIKIWGEKSNVVRYLNRTRISKPILTYFTSLKERVMKARKEDEQKRIDAERENNRIKLGGKAILYLISKGVEIDEENMQIDMVIQEANEIAFDEAVKKKQKELSESSGYVSFSGNCYCEDCCGWDGRSHRCACGNRRVNWVYDGSPDFFLNPMIYAEAY